MTCGSEGNRKKFCGSFWMYRFADHVVDGSVTNMFPIACYSDTDETDFFAVRISGSGGGMRIGNFSEDSNNTFHLEGGTQFPLGVWRQVIYRIDTTDSNNRVNYNYGYQWDRNGQLDRIIQMLQDNPDNRQCAISIYDGKEIDDYKYDTPCTYAIQFTIVHNRLDMCVTMRSNDLWYGFCNDQYQFSKLQEMVSKQLDIETGVYYHFAHNMHLYNDKI